MAFIVPMHCYKPIITYLLDIFSLACIAARRIFMEKIPLSKHLWQRVQILYDML